MSELIPELKMLISYLRTKGQPRGCAECQSPEWAAATVIEHLHAENEELKLKIKHLESQK